MIIFQKKNRQSPSDFVEEQLNNIYMYVYIYLYFKETTYVFFLLIKILTLQFLLLLVVRHCIARLKKPTLPYVQLYYLEFSGSKLYDLKENVSQCCVYLKIIFRQSLSFILKTRRKVFLYNICNIGSLGQIFVHKLNDKFCRKKIIYLIY